MSDDAVHKGELFEDFKKHPAWDLFIADVEAIRDSIDRARSGKVVNDINVENFNNGRWRGLFEALSVVNKAIEAKNRVIAESDNTQGGISE